MADEQIHAWLTRIELPQYAPVFDANCIEMDVLAHLTAADLEDLGMAPGARQRLLPALRASLRHRPGRRGEARAPPAPIYASFTAGFQTKDLRAAKRVLEGLQA